MSDEYPTIRLEGEDVNLDYIFWDIEQTAEPLWSDGTLDRSFVPKIVGYVNNKPRGKIILREGRIIYFSSVSKFADGSFVINQPYRIE